MGFGQVKLPKTKMGQQVLAINCFRRLLARNVLRKCRQDGLDEAFPIRYQHYKGVEVSKKFSDFSVYLLTYDARFESLIAELYEQQLSRQQPEVRYKEAVGQLLRGWTEGPTATRLKKIKEHVLIDLE